MSYKDKREISSFAKVMNFMFGRGEKEEELTPSQYLDMRCRINNKEFNSALIFFNILGEYYSCEPAKLVGDILKRQSISFDGRGRQEGLMAIIQEFPSVEVLEKGVSKRVQELERGGG